MGYNRTTYKGKFRPTYPEKYTGDHTNIVYRSSWELQFMRWCDHNSKVVQWSSEETIIPYRSPLDNRIHRYFPDFLVKIRDDKEQLVDWLVEVKPKHQTQPPKKKLSKGKPSKRYVQEVQTYVVNQAKFEAAREYCDNKGMKFMILTEDYLKTPKR